MKGAKRFAASDSAMDAGETAFRNKRVVEGSPFDVLRAEADQQKSNMLPPLNVHRAESSRQHVRALNTQFASWVQTQLKNHPDELWEDGVADYLSHASNIMEKFSDVVNWLKANATRGGSAKGSLTVENKVSEIKDNGNKLSQEKAGFLPASTSASITNSWNSGVFSNNQGPGGLLSTSQSSTALSSAGAFSSSQNSSSFSSGGIFSGSQASSSFSSGIFFSSLNSSTFSSGGGFSSSQNSSLFANSQGSRLSPNDQSSGFTANSQTFGLFSPIQSTGLLSNSQSTGLFSNSQAPVLFGGQSLVPSSQNPANDADDDELPQPSSPSVKKSEEKGIVVVHEVRCKLYVKSTDPEDKDTWKDKGTGHLSIKVKEGISKGTKESQPIIVVRNEVGKVLLNALLYPGIKTSLQKNSLVAIFHTAGDDGGNSETVTARTFLIRAKSEEDRNKLATAIQEYAPVS